MTHKATAALRGQAVRGVRAVLRLNVGSGEVHRILVHGGRNWKLEECNIDQIRSMRPITHAEIVDIEPDRLCGHCMSAERVLAEAEDA